MRVTAGRIAALAATVVVLFPQQAGAEGPITIHVTQPTENETVTGRTVVSATTTGEVVQVTFDYSPDGGSTWQVIGADVTAEDGWSVDWDTAGYSGPAQVRATATDGEVSTEDRVAVTVDNTPPKVHAHVSVDPFSPNGDGRKDSTQLRATSNEPAKLALALLDSGDRLIVQWRSQQATRAFAVVWNGRAQGRVVPDGRYRVEARAVDAAGLTGSASVRLVVDTRAPRLSWRRLAPSVFTEAGVLHAEYRARDRAKTLHATLVVSDTNGVVQRIHRTTGTGLNRFRYVTRYRSGTPLYPGLYTVAVHARDDAGNRSKSSAKRWRMHRAVSARVFRRIEGAGRRIALTFDDCNYPAAWRRILRELSRRDGKATFFCPGQQVMANPELARRTVRTGHAIGAHGWDHALLAGRSKDATAWRLKSDRSSWWKIARTTSAALFRPPYGALDRNVIAAAGETAHGRIVLWDVDPSDYTGVLPGVVATRVLRSVRPGSIVLLHVKDNTAAALPAILDGLAARRLEAVTLHRLFRAGGFR